MNTLPNIPTHPKTDNFAKNSSTKTSTANPAWANPVFFPEWREHLMLEPFDDQRKTQFIRAIAAFFIHCKTIRKLSAIGVAKAYLGAGAEQGNCGQIDRDALRWFFVTYRKEFGDGAGRDTSSICPSVARKPGGNYSTPCSFCTGPIPSHSQFITRLLTINLYDF